MTDSSLQFAELKVYRVRGVPRDQGFALPALSRGVNLIYGPNASGKSTTARVIQELLWPGRTGLDRPSIMGRFSHDGHQWAIDIDAGHVQTLRDGTPGNAPQFGPPENRHRYHLALHELVQQENRNSDFAKQIADASQGGYDLNAAAAALDYREKPPGRLGERQALDRQGDNVRQARERQAHIEHDAHKLKDLQVQHAAALEAERAVGRLSKAQDYRIAVKTHRSIEIELEAIPEGVGRLRGDERDDLDRLADQQAQREKDRSAEEDRITRAQTALEEAGLSEEGVNRETLTLLRSWQHQLADFETDIRQHKRTVDEAEATAEQARRRLGDHITDEQLAAIDRVKIDDLDAFAPKFEQFRAEKTLLRERQKWLQADEPEAVRDLDAHQLHDGIAALGRWLAASVSPRQARTRASWVLVLAVVLVVGLAIALGVAHHIAWVAAAVLAPVLLWLDWRDRRASGQEDVPDDQRVHRGTFEQTKLVPPVAWGIKEVTTRLRELVDLASARALEDERARRRADLADVKQNLTESERALSEERAALQKQLGVEIAIDATWLSQLLKKIDQWQDASSRASGAGESLGRLHDQHVKICQQVNAAIKPFGYEPVETAEAARLKIEDLDGRRQKQKEATSAIEEAHKRLENTIRPGLQEITDQRAAIFERLQLNPDQEPTIDDWLVQREAYLDLKSKLTESATLRADRETALTDHEDLLDLDEVDLQQCIDTEQAVADRRDDLHAEIVRIEHEIEQAKEGHDVTDALTAYEAARAGLEKAREQCSAAVVGHTLTNWIRQVAVDQSRPDVFGRANEILGKFSRYTLKLELDDHASPPAFLAQRSTGETSPVDDLSVGERVQLLMAVRVAFIEQEEISRLPLLLDETLGTSDDARAGFIIDSVIQLAREGRQVFYFTAQHDEVAKWRARLEQSDVSYKLIDLATIRSENVAQTTPLQITPIQRPQPSPPDGRGYTAYGQLLNVPGLNPAANNIANVHLWHLLDDAHQLHRLLCEGICTWGQLRLLQDQGSAGLVEPVVLQRAASVAKAIETAFDAWRIGRGRPVNRQALLDSGSVTDAFIDAVSELADQLSGDAGQLIDALDDRQVTRWRHDNTEALRGYFAENGYLTYDSSLTATEIRVRIIAALSEDLKSGLLDDAKIDRIIGSLPI